MKRLIVGILALIFILSTFTPNIAWSVDVDINGSFEQDINSNNLPDFWEANLRIGNAIGSFAANATNTPVDGTKHYRLYSGTGDASSYHFASSNQIPVLGGITYQAEAFMRYSIGSSSQAQFSIIQLDAHGNSLGENHKVFNNGGSSWHDNFNISIVELNILGTTISEVYHGYKNGAGQWNDNSKVYKASPNAHSILIRFAVGGEIGAYLDIDEVSLTPVNFPGKIGYIYDHSGRVNYLFTPSGQIINYQYDRNGNLLKKVKIQ